MLLICAICLEIVNVVLNSIVLRIWSEHKGHVTREQKSTDEVQLPIMRVFVSATVFRWTTTVSDRVEAATELPLPQCSLGSPYAYASFDCCTKNHDGAIAISVFFISSTDQILTKSKRTI